MRRKIWSILILFVLSSVLAGCQRDSAPDSYLERAHLLLTQVERDFYAAEQGVLRMYVPENPKENYLAYMWPYLSVVGAAGRYLGEAEDKALTLFLDETIQGLEAYRALSPDYHYYDSYPLEYGGGEPFYDDNVWVVLNLLDTGVALGRDELVTQAMEIMEYVYSGWNEALGAINWRSTMPTANTCTNAPAAIASALLYQQSNEERYLDWAKTLYDWCVREMLDSRDYCYWDHIRLDGTKDMTKWTYNTGMMIYAGTLLYEITGEARYLEEARLSADGALEMFGKLYTEGELTYYIYPKTPWFNLLLLQGFIAYDSAAGETRHVDSLKSALDYAWENSRDENGYVYADWGAAGPVPNPHYAYLLDQASTAECYVLLSQWEAYVKAR